MPKYLTAAEVALELRRSPRTVYRWLGEGFFPHAFKVKDGHLIPQADINRLSRKRNGSSRSSEDAED